MYKVKSFAVVSMSAVFIISTGVCIYLKGTDKSPPGIPLFDVVIISEVVPVDEFITSN